MVKQIKQPIQTKFTIQDQPKAQAPHMSNLNSMKMTKTKLPNNNMLTLNSSTKKNQPLDKKWRQWTVNPARETKNESSETLTVYKYVLESISKPN